MNRSSCTKGALEDNFSADYGEFPASGNFLKNPPSPVVSKEFS